MLNDPELFLSLTKVNRYVNFCSLVPFLRYHLVGETVFAARLQLCFATRLRFLQIRSCGAEAEVMLVTSAVVVSSLFSLQLGYLLDVLSPLRNMLRL